MPGYGVPKVLDLEAPLEARRKEPAKGGDDRSKHCHHHRMQLQVQSVVRALLSDISASKTHGAAYQSCVHFEELKCSKAFSRMLVDSKEAALTQGYLH